MSDILEPYVMIMVDRRKKEAVMPVSVTVNPDKKMNVLGILGRRADHRPFNRHEEGFWPEG